MIDEIFQSKKGATIEVRSIIGQHASPALFAHKQRPKMVSKIVLHQCGCPMPETIAGWSKLNAHLGITKSGKIYWINNPVDFIWHANGLSPDSIGIEVEGNWYGVQGDPKTLWKGGGTAATMNKNIVCAIIKAFELCHNWIISQIPVSKWERLTNAKPEFQGVFAHRQSSEMRVWDCGQELYTVANSFNKLILDAGALDKCRQFKCGTGAPIPKEWLP